MPSGDRPMDEPNPKRPIVGPDWRLVAAVQTFIGEAIGMIAVGGLLDYWLGTTPWAIAVCGLLGLALAFFHLQRFLSRLRKNEP
ncbi:MAG: AtpZ/AtpI family protein [Planctomycetia bacterium]